jgi:ABC-type nitrate/sulfonate/bicarbonate transport system ATPase subunit
MVTHDVDEALFLSDRVAMMTNGPAARLGGVVEIPFARPRDRESLLEHPLYYDLREQLIGFLEDQSHGGGRPEAEARAVPPRSPAAERHAPAVKLEEAK